MNEFLVFTVYAPLASWGDTAVGEVRSSWDRPSRSAILGLVAAALGIDREDQERHAELDRSYGIGVRLALGGTALIDYHTSQDPTGVAVRRFKPRTRRAALDCADPLTTLSQRTLRQDALSVVALWRRSGSRWTMEDLASAMRTPHFVLYAGRKANVLGLPLSPAVVQADTLAAALAPVPRLPREVDRLKPGSGWGREVAFDRCDAFQSGFVEKHDRTVRRRDAQPHRGRWQFAERDVYVNSIPEDAKQ